MRRNVVLTDEKKRLLDEARRARGLGAYIKNPVYPETPYENYRGGKYVKCTGCGKRMISKTEVPRCRGCRVSGKT